MASFSKEEREALYSLFRLDEHEIREGSTSKDKRKIQWFTYIRREAIQTRLDSSFFGEWELYFLNPESPAIYHKEHVDCSMGLSIRGIRREFNGSQDGGGLNGAKGAATDAFKRVASMWGIGLYLQDSPQIWTENYKDADGKADWDKKKAVEKEAMQKVGNWLKSIGAIGESLFSEDNPTPAQQQTPIVPDRLSPEAHGLAGGKDENNEEVWLKTLKAITLPLYAKGSPHQNNSINKALSNKLISPDMDITTAACKIFAHRIFEEKTWGIRTEADLRAACLHALGSSLSAYLSKSLQDGETVKDSLKSAWDSIKKAAETMPE